MPCKYIVLYITPIRAYVVMYACICIDLRAGMYVCKYACIHSGYFYSASSSPLLLRLKGAPDYTALILCRG